VVNVQQHQEIGFGGATREIQLSILITPSNATEDVEDVHQEVGTDTTETSMMMDTL